MKYLGCPIFFESGSAVHPIHNRLPTTTIKDPEGRLKHGPGRLCNTTIVREEKALQLSRLHLHAGRA
jgi:hypothetical protein